MRRRDALAALMGLGLTACGPRPRRRHQPGQTPPSTGPQRIGAVPLAPVTGATGNHTGPAPRPTPRRQLSLDQWRATLTANRAVQQRRLREYAARRMFPIYLGPDRVAHIHHRELTSREPVFVDHRGVHCAVGYLMDRSGWSQAVDGIVRANNNVYVEEVDDGALIRWIEASGLTQQEAAFIQPSYNWEPEPAPRPRPRPPDDEPDLKPPPPPPPTDDHMATEVARLLEHFAEVDAQLTEDAEMSIDEALHRLEPRLEAGLPTGELT